MSQKSKKIIFFGNERLATGVTTKIPVLRGLLASSYDVAVVIISRKPTNSRHQRKLEVEEFALAHNIPILYPAKVIDLIDELKDIGATAGILAAYGKIIPQRLIDIFPAGIINVHPSLLPKHRGPTPIESVILEGSNKTGVSIMLLTKEMDSGPLFGQSNLVLDGTESKQYIADKLGDLGQKLLIKDLPAILNSSLKATTQDNANATYDSLITKNDGKIDWHKPASILERQIRAYSGWPGSSTVLGKKDVVITGARVVKQQGPAGNLEFSKNSLLIYAGRDALSVLSLLPVGKNEMSIQEYLAGYRRWL